MFTMRAAIIYPLFSILALALGGCSDQPLNSAGPARTATSRPSIADKAAAFAQSPAGQALANTVINVAIDGATQYAGSGRIDSRQLAADTLDGGAQTLRSLAGTNAATSPNAVNFATAEGISNRHISQQVAPLIAANVSRQIEHGTPPDTALENLATTMNAAAAKIRVADKGP